MTDPGSVTTLVLGIGNLIMTDDGIGVRVVRELKRNHRIPSGLAIVDGGTLGLGLLPRLNGIDRLLIIDVVETGQLPGTMVRLTGDEIPLAQETRVSPHQMGLKYLLAVASLQGNVPSEMVLLGVQPEPVAVGLALSPSVSSALPFLCNRVGEVGACA